MYATSFLWPRGKQLEFPRNCKLNKFRAIHAKSYANENQFGIMNKPFSFCPHKQYQIASAGATSSNPRSSTELEGRADI